MDPEAYIEHCNSLTEAIIGAAIEAHRALGPGLLESAYELALCRELDLRGYAFRRQVAVPLSYKGVSLGTAFKMDILVEELVILEIKAVAKLEPIYEAQLLTYLRLSNRYLGLVMNFNQTRVKDGIRRVVNSEALLA
jgi:GxxExxY protein